MNSMSETPRKSRDLDHLMEQNSTELDFLSAYGGSSSEGDGAALFSALRRFLKAGSVAFTVNKKETSLTFHFGKASIVDNGCLISFKGKNLPLVTSDLQQAGFIQGKLTKTRTSCKVTLVEWGIEQRRFVERMVEYLNHGE
jgi:hypothetical protein|tara:strand:- start:754 stop:1176 length:423 start_codon:yes stop_codon:yes gene_type:complete